MLKNCVICGKIHDFNKVCKRPYKYQKRRKTDRFRGTYEWKQKREEIKKRDKYLCVACLNGLDNTSSFMFNYKDLQVHHIISIDEDYSKRLDSDNLITLCPYHHKRAEDGYITKEQLLNFIEKE